MRRLILLAATILAGALAAQPAHAAAGLETGIADDAILLAGGEDAAAEVAAWQRAGVDVARIQARWVAIAPGATAPVAPAGFHARDPDDPRYNWGALDRAVALVRAAGIRPMLQITGSGPLWSSRAPGRRNPRYKPSPAEFADFTAAVAARFRTQVDRYEIFNEPNQPLWLQPQFACRKHRCTPVAPDLYRDLYRAAAREIRALDPGAQLLMGSLAPKGQNPRAANAVMRPLTFVRALGCVDARYRRVRSGACAHAQRITATGFAYHPHPVRQAPDEPSAGADDAALGSLGRLESALDRTARAGVIGPAGAARFPLYLTEFGYQTDPPDPAAGIAPSLQATWLQWSWYRGFRDPRVRNMTQYEWRDEPLGRHVGSLGRYAGWQSGLLYADGRAKPALAVFPHPFWVDVRPGRRLATFWGQVRPGGATTVRLMRGRTVVRTLRTNAAGAWSTTRAVTAPATYHYEYETAQGVQRSTSQRVAPRAAAPGARRRARRCRPRRRRARATPPARPADAPGSTPRVAAGSTTTAKPSFSASSAVARTQWSVAIPDDRDGGDALLAQQPRRGRSPRSPSSRQRPRRGPCRRRRRSPRAPARGEARPPGCPGRSAAARGRPARRTRRGRAGASRGWR